MAINDVMCCHFCLIYLFIFSTVIYGFPCFEERPSSGSLRNILFDSNNDAVYVGAVDNIYQLNSRLGSVNSIATGPGCPYNSTTMCQSCADRKLPNNCSFYSEPVPNVNQMLVINSNAETLIACGSLHFGLCELIDLGRFTPIFYPNIPSVVPSSDKQSVVGFMGNGINNEKSVLYVGYSYGKNNSDAGHLISMRDPDTLESFTRYIDILPGFDAFSIHFVVGFQRGKFIYFLVEHKKSSETDDELKSFVIRICKDNPALTSFIELPLICQHSGFAFPRIRDAVLAPFFSTDSVDSSTDAVYAVFTTADNEHSAVCIYPMDELDSAFQRAIQDCFKGDGFKGPNYVTKDNEACIATNVDIDKEYCGNFSYNYPIAGNSAIQPHRVSMRRNTLATSVQANMVNNINVIFIGTSLGQLLKMFLDGSGNGSQYGHVDEVVKGLSQSVKDIIFGPSDNLYLLMDKSVCSVPTFDCSKAHTCEICVEDPHCGWCMENKRCTKKEDCVASVAMDTWLNYFSQCPSSEILSSNVAVNLMRQTRVVLTVSYIPDISESGEVKCSVKNKNGSFVELVSAEVVDNDQQQKMIICSILTNTMSLGFQDGMFYAKLFVSISLGGLSWFENSFSVFDCGLLEGCIGCLESTFPCNWCAEKHLCRHSSLFQDCTSDLEQQISLVNQSTLCPKVELLSNKTLLLLGSGQSKEFSFKAINIMPFHDSSQLKCRFKVNDYIYSKAVLQLIDVDISGFQKNFVNCSPVPLEYAEDIASKYVPFDLVWGTNSEFVIDNPNHLQVEVFKCRYKASNCGHCLTLSEIYGCVWCRHPQSCSLTAHCEDPAFLDRNAVCPNPEIISFTPKGGPLLGKTLLTITGVNLGKVVGDLSIQVVHVTCTIVPDVYVPTESVICTTGPMMNDNFNGTVVVSVHGLPTPAESSQLYIYKDPQIDLFFPRQGPMSGGTVVVATGTNLDYGTLVEVVIGLAKAPVMWRNETHIQFVIPPYSGPFIQSEIAIRFDGTEVCQGKHFYIYSEDPTVTKVHPNVALFSGGNLLDVRGSNLLIVVRPQFIIYTEDGNLTTRCHMVSASSFMQCPTPDLRDIDIKSLGRLSFDYGFIMDDVQKLLHRQKENPDEKQIQYIPDPVVYKFDSPVSHRPDLQMEISGKNLNVFEHFTDVSILVNEQKCTSLKFTESKISCNPPSAIKDLNEDGDALVMITLGNFVQEVGYLSYYDYGPSLPLIIGIVCGVAIPLVIALVLLIVCCRRKQLKRQNNFVFGSRNVSDSNQQNPRYNNYSETLPLRDYPHHIDEQLNMQETTRDDSHFIQELLKRIENPRRRNAAREVLISRERLEIGSIIGRGHFSCVQSAVLKDNSMRNQIQVIAKTVEGPEFDESVLETILRECVVMKNFNHPRIISIVGLCLGYRSNPILILPYMVNGNLRTYIKDKSKNFTARQLLLLSQQVAEGMSYLSSLNFIHRNLAARNCMLNDSLEAQVSDFVLCQELYEHRLQFGTSDQWIKFPIKWMAPETLEGFVFTTASDVWAFGVLMWELMTRGVTPYPDVPLLEIKNFLTSGCRLKQPKYCPKNVYKIMLDCWQAVPERRPMFTDLVNRLELLLNPPSKRHLNNSMSQEEEPLYINTTDPNSPNYLRPLTSTNNNSNP